MLRTPEQKRIGETNFQEAVGKATRRDFLKGAVALTGGLGAAYFGYSQLAGDPVRVAFIGTGDEGSILLNEHPPEYMDVVAIADIRPTNRRRALYGDGNDVRQGLIKKLGAKKAKSIKLFKDHRELIANARSLGLEGVVVAVPLSHHAPIAIDCMQAGLHVLCEKLMAKTIDQCKEMLRVRRESRVLLAVGHQRHYSVLYANANDLVQQGLLGDLKFIRAHWHRNNSFPGRDSWRDTVPAEDRQALESIIESRYGYESMEQLVNWRLYNETGGGLMAELGSHQLDAASIFLNKEKPLAVQGYGGKNFYGVEGVGSWDKQADPREIDDHVYVILEFPGPNYYEKDENGRHALDKNGSAVVHEPDDIVVVTYSSINTNRLEPYGEALFGSRGSLYMEQEQSAQLYKESSPVTGEGGLDQRLYVVTGKDGKPVMQASESLAPTQGVESKVTGKISRGYTEEMEHFCHAIRNEENFEDPRGPAEGGLRCNGEVAMGDAIMALTCNLAMKYKKRVEFRPEWFKPDDSAAPEKDPAIIG
ncbi:MAG: Gfo/Idh/MocA family oxidoreductase [Planctomycetes bacterium]|nr:Gfo/Idh/MocA family oxidoreductase [Planctomycetota bacterium]